MAISRIWQAGMETGSIKEFHGITNTPTASVAQKKTGSYGFASNSVTNKNGWVIVPATRQIRMGFWFNPMVLVPLSSGHYDVCYIQSAAPANLINLHQRAPAYGGAAELDIGGVDQDVALGMMEASIWHHYVLDVKVDNAAGWAKVYRDGVEILSFAGNTGNADITKVIFGVGVSPAITQYYDDMYVDDTTGEGAAAVGPILRFPYIVPDGAGNYTQWDPSAGNNWDCVDEVPPSDADYVETNVVDEFDSYTMTTYTIDTGETVQAVIPIVRVQRSDVTEEIAVGTREGGVDLIGADQVPDAAWNYLFERQTAQPGGGAWDQAAITGVESVIKSRGSY